MCKKMIYLVSFVLVLGLVNSASADLVGHWRFDEGSGTIASDSSGNGNNGTLVAGPTWVNGWFGGALEFDGADDRVDVGSFDLTTDTITYVALVNGSFTGDYSAIIFGRHVDRQITGIRLRSNSRLSYCWNNASAATYQWGGAPQVPVDEWALVAVTIEPERATAYVITQSQGLQSASNEIPHVSQQTTNLLIGWDANMNNGFQGIIDEVQIHDRALTPDELQSLFDRGSVVLVGARGPSPVNAETDVLRNVVLSWTPGVYADKHDVYFGTSFGDVNDVSLTEDPGGVYLDRQDPNTLALDRLDLGQTYYWRVDEVNAAPDYTVYEGSVWQFTVEPVGYPIAGENINATASSSNSAVEDPNNTINGSGLDADDLHSMQGTDMWLSDSESLGAWIQYEFDKVYKLHEMWVWNSNQMVESTIGFGLKDVTIEYSADGTDWIELGDVPEFAQAPGTDGYAHNTTVDLSGIAAKYVRLTASSNWGGFMPKYGLSEVRFFYIPIHAREPDPDSGATDVSIGTMDEPIDVTLGWRAGREAAMHDVYLSPDEQAVIDGTAPVTTVTEARHGPLSLDVGQTYYWRVDEVNEAEIPTTWHGDVWDFTTQEYFVLDDFEDYNDFEPDRVFDTWIDGWELPENGSQIGYVEPPFAEQAIIHGGKQSIPFSYNNTGGVAYSEAERTFATPRDWTVRGVGALSLWFRGYPASAGSFVEGPVGTYTMTASSKDIFGTSDEFHFAYKTLAGPGSIIAKVENVEKANESTKAGVMIRETLDPDSRHVFVFFRGEIRFNSRIDVGGTSPGEGGTGVTYTAPYWLKLVRYLGGSFRAYQSADGSNWELLGTTQPILMADDVYIGLALTSHDAALTCEAKFSNVQTTGTVTGQWQSQDIGILSNNPESMYVAVANSTGMPAVVYHDDPGATQIDTWTEWNIPLTDFTGVNLQTINKLSIGVGDKNNPQAGGSGVMYFDDIRLYPLR